MSSEEFCKCHEFFKRMDLNGSCTWDVSCDRLFIKYISTRKRGTCQKCMSTSTIRLLTLSFRRRGGSYPFKWEMSTQNRGTQTILGRLNLFYIGCGIMIFFSEHKNKEIKKKVSSPGKISFVFKYFDFIQFLQEDRRMVMWQFWKRRWHRWFFTGLWK